MQTDFYAVLGVSKTTAAADIKRAYRRLTQKYHPDKNPDDPAAAEQIRRVNEAWAVLGDAGKRRDYDEFGDASLARTFDGRMARDLMQRETERLLFEARVRRETEEALRRAAVKRGEDVQLLLDVPFLTALRGGVVQVHGVSVPIPRGTADGAIITLAGHGHPGRPENDPRQRGDLILTARVPGDYPNSDDPVLTRKGRDLILVVELTWYQIMKGGRILIPTPWGPYPLFGRPYVSAGADGEHLGYSTFTVPNWGVKCACHAACQCPKGSLYIQIQHKPPTTDESGVLLQVLHRLQESENPQEKLMRSFALGSETL